MILVLGCMFCFYLIVKGAEIYTNTLAHDPSQRDKALKIATGVMFACFIAAAGFLFWLNQSATKARDIPAALFGGK